MKHCPSKPEDKYTHTPATATTPPVEAKSSANYTTKTWSSSQSRLIPLPVLVQCSSFLTSTESRPQEPWFTTHRINKFNRPYANLMYERASKLPCTLGILTSADFFWKQSDSPTRRTFYGNSYTAPTPSIHTIQQLGLAISKSYSSLLTNAAHTFQRPPTAPQIRYLLFPGSLGRHISRRYVAS